MTPKTTRRIATPPPPRGFATFPEFTPELVAIRKLAQELKLTPPEDGQDFALVCGHADLVQPAVAAFVDPSRPRSDVEKTKLFGLALHSFNQAMVRTEKTGLPLPMKLEAFLSFVRQHPEQRDECALFRYLPLGPHLDTLKR